MRKLATIREVTETLPIEGRDRIELAIFDGWQIIVKKDEFKPGDKAVFIEIDSVLPEKPEFEFLRNKNFRIKTMKMSGVLSQGICFPLDILPKREYEIGEDVTDIIGIKQYEATRDLDPVEVKSSNSLKRYLFRFKIIRTLFGKTKRQKQGFPDFIVKTDESRVQNLPNILKDKSIKYEVTEKLDGSSMTTFMKKGIFKAEFGVCSRNIRLSLSHIQDNEYIKAVKKYNIKNVLTAIMKEYKANLVVLQGEILSPKIQGNKYKVSEVDFYGFNLIIDGVKIKGEKAKEIVSRHGVKWVPILDTSYVLPDTVSEILQHATAKSEIGETIREGCVYRNYEKNISFKAVSPDFLIKYDA
jgi:hypothetical protein